MKPVGILGGMGPEATILLMQKVLSAVDARDDADHVPLIVHQNPQVPSRIAALIDGVGTDPGPTLAAMARDLEKAGAQALAMPCNTAHHYAPQVEGATPLPFLNMIELAAEEFARSGAKRVGMLASPATRLANVFDPVFSRQSLQPVWTEDEEAMLRLIRQVKAGADAQVAGHKFAELAEGLAAQGADHLLIACTELSLLVDFVAVDPPCTDSLDCLTSAIVKFSRRTVT